MRVFARVTGLYVLLLAAQACSPSERSDQNLDVVIDTDSHHTRDLVRMDYGVRYARRGWVTANRVLNARTLDEVLASVAARRAR